MDSRRQKKKYYKRNRRASFAKIEVQAIIDLGTATWRSTKNRKISGNWQKGNVKRYDHLRQWIVFLFVTVLFNQISSISTHRAIKARIRFQSHLSTITPASVWLVLLLPPYRVDIINVPGRFCFRNKKIKNSGCCDTVRITDRARLGSWETAAAKDLTFDSVFETLEKRQSPLLKLSNKESLSHSAAT